MIELLAFSTYLKLMTAMSVTFCLHVDEPRVLNYCTSHIMERVLDGEAIEFCGGLYIKDRDSWN